MLCDRVLGKWAGDASHDANRLDVLELRWDECHRRAQSKTTRLGKPVRLLLRLGTTLRHHDILFESQALLLVVELIPCETMVVRPRTVLEASLAAVELGNLHAPVQITASDIITLSDGPAAGVLARHGIAFTREIRRFEPMPISGITWSVSEGGAVVSAAPALVRKVQT